MDKQVVAKYCKAAGAILGSAGSIVALASKFFGADTTWGMVITGLGIIIHNSSSAVNELMDVLGSEPIPASAVPPAPPVINP